MKASFLRLMLPAALFAGVTLGHAQFIINNNTNAAGQPFYDYGPAILGAFVGDTAVTNNAVISDANLNLLGVKGGSNANGLDDADGVFGGADQ